MKNEWRVEHESDTYPDGEGGSTYSEWWSITDGEYTSFRADFQDDAEMLVAALNGRKDAARYQVLRRGQEWSVVDGIGDTLSGDVLDAAIDAAMR